MKKSLTIFTILSLIAFSAVAQQQIRGRVTDPEGNPVIGANVYLLNTYDGTATDTGGYFSFSTREQGVQQLMASAVGYAPFSRKTDPATIDGDLDIILYPESTELDDLVITAGVFEASDEKKAVALKPLDIVTTAGATADIPGVMNTLPGTQTVGEKGRLFIRGGESRESRNFIDGILVGEPYALSPVNIPARMRFSPFLFSGTTFSTGGYSAEYGQALSGTLILRTDDEPLQTQTDLSLMTVGASVAHTQKWESNSIFLESAYSDLSPYFHVIPQKAGWERAPRSWQNTFMFRQKLRDQGQIRIFYSNDFSDMKIDQALPHDINRKMSVGLSNRYHYINTNIERTLKEHWFFYGGISGTWSDQMTDVGTQSEQIKLRDFHWKAMAIYDRGGKLSLKTGIDQYYFYVRQTMNSSENATTISGSRTEWLPAVFLESDITFSGKFMGRIGIRSEYRDQEENLSLLPRLSLAYKLGEKSQISMATGIYRQRPAYTYRLIRGNLEDEQAIHYILNYQWTRDHRNFRVELYHKDYDRLIRFASNGMQPPSDLSNTGYGRASGLDIFWRDSKTFRNVDYWISYSYMNTRRLYHDFPEEAVPGFATPHNLSLVYKHFIMPLRIQLGVTYTFASGRLYTDPNLEGFQNAQTPAYHDLSANLSYLITSNFILHFSMTNIPGLEPTFGRQYSLEPNASGIYESIPVRPPARRFIFLGLFLTLSKDQKTNQIRNL